MKIKLKPLIPLLVILTLTVIGFIYMRYFVYTNEVAQYKVYLNQDPAAIYQSPQQNFKVEVCERLDGLNYVTWLDLEVKPEGLTEGLQGPLLDPPTGADLSMETSLTPGIGDYRVLLNQIIKVGGEPLKSVPDLVAWIQANIHLEGGRIQEWVINPRDNYLDDRMLLGIDALSAEYATVFSGLMRAQGIPTRTVGGHIYMDDQYALMIWNEIWIDGEGWKTVDVRHKRMGSDNRYIRFFCAPDYTSYIDQLTSLKFGVERTNW